MPINVEFKDLGLIEYQKAWDLQAELFEEVTNSKKNEITLEQRKNFLLFCEHPHVYTLGKNGQENNLLINQIQLQAKNATFFQIDRGGDITYHGPGQIVGYPIIDLEVFNLGVKKYVWLLEESVIETLKHYDINSGRLDGASGVWLDTDVKGKTRKICAIGIKVSRFVTMHGFAFNVNTNLDYFNYINPCGFIDKGVTSMKKELGKEINFDEVKLILKEKIFLLLEKSKNKTF